MMVRPHAASKAEWVQRFSLRLMALQPDLAALAAVQFARQEYEQSYELSPERAVSAYLTARRGESNWYMARWHSEKLISRLQSAR